MLQCPECGGLLCATRAIKVRKKYWGLSPYHQRLICLCGYQTLVRWHSIKRRRPVTRDKLLTAEQIDDLVHRYFELEQSPTEIGEYYHIHKNTVTAYIRDAVGYLKQWGGSQARLPHSEYERIRLLHHKLDYTVPEIAEMLNLNVHTVRSRMKAGGIEPRSQEILMQRRQADERQIA